MAGLRFVIYVLRAFTITSPPAVIYVWKRGGTEILVVWLLPLASTQNAAPDRRRRRRRELIIGSRFLSHFYRKLPQRQKFMPPLTAELKLNLRGTLPAALQCRYLPI